ncbi:hypothetical protein BN14_00106 [Rhizoctonia solani AG-1 IB]|uniref:Uncharacterized protein n=2 Tax=Rhizoctonia solani TaxID=456999 RepID=A0A8H3AF96_9AGAM|nr:unnamed protein product [Rhizoctonia solani]CCO26089.1 hypothetical protein BN14_00106 [Rhizoctonia solani AG-1 IB]
MVDRLMIEAKKHTLPGWCPGGTKEAEWRKRKRLWVAEEARDAAAAVQALNRTNTGVAAHVVARPASRPVIQPRIHPPQPLFLDDEDEDEDGDDDDDDYYIYGLGYDYDLDYDQYDQYD